MNSEDRDAQDARLSAWLDGELDKDGTEQMSDRIAFDEVLRQRADRLARLDELVRAAVPEEPLPAELLVRLGLAPRESADVVDLAAARRERGVGPARTTVPAWRTGMWRIAAQVLVVGGIGLGAVLALAPNHDRLAPGQTAPDAAYRTLSDHPSAVQPAVNALVVFSDATDPATARRIAGAAGASLVGEPTAGGAWKASIAPTRRDAVLAVLRRDARVSMAETIDGAGR